MVQSFTFAKPPRIVFGAGKFSEVPKLVRKFGEMVLIVTGGSSFQASTEWESLIKALDTDGVNHYHLSVEREPSPELVDKAVTEFRDAHINVVLACGGGSVMDAGKAISAMLPKKESVLNYLEGIGTGAPHDGSKIPFIAVPTTAGTGSEATKNAVLSKPGRGGFKKSLRHDKFVPDVAVLDPLLTVSCPPHVTAASGLDAFTQLLESYVSKNASPMTDALALSGLECAARCLLPACTNGAKDVSVRAGMTYAALISGITLANAGLGVVHGLASPIGALFDAPHGVVCGTLVGTATSATIKKLLSQHGARHPSLRKYARVGFIIHGRQEGDTAEGCELLLRKVSEWVEILKIPRLGAYGIHEEDLNDIAAQPDNKSNPAALDRNEVLEVLLMRL
ncbi:MAG: iron-containing alcohol dehydrogenase [Candidatus Abyssobacteria bacterium SURF_17]|jgi:alcohol dehydrogenase class IV|uniref:Iron-containing alcohol dehydrogenase n=1 Tax=Candidatus Abyssobacteria bacterium SURF_17 TaxID=2093361 RepID=A0A419EQ21_9BACT|nr:MAG: iron-containing alcohol dehydrogenase [Candidatus Abyssubacteria bacterium SURF_17]